MIKGLIQQEEITLVNIYVPKIGAPKYIKQVLTEIEGEGRLGGTAVKASAFGSGRDPGVMGSSPISGSSAMSLLLPLPLPLLVFLLSLAVSISVE